MDENQREWEFGAVRAHPLRFMWLQIKQIWNTWMYARKVGRDPNVWYGVYVKGTDLVIAECGVGLTAAERAQAIVHEHRGILRSMEKQNER